MSSLKFFKSAMKLLVFLGSAWAWHFHHRPSSRGWFLCPFSTSLPPRHQPDRAFDRVDIFPCLHRRRRELLVLAFWHPQELPFPLHPDFLLSVDDDKIKSYYQIVIKSFKDNLIYVLFFCKVKGACRAKNQSDWGTRGNKTRHFLIDLYFFAEFYTHSPVHTNFVFEGRGTIQKGSKITFYDRTRMGTKNNWVLQF